MHGSPLAAPFLRSLTNYNSAAGMADSNHTLTVATRNLFQSLTRSAQPVPPMEFILSLRRAYPQFGQTSRRAGRCWEDRAWGDVPMLQHTRCSTAADACWELRLASECHTEPRGQPRATQPKALMHAPAPPVLPAGRASTCSRMRTSAGETS